MLVDFVRRNSFGTDRDMQFIIGTDVAQGTDVLCNVFGIVVGSCAYISWAKSVIKFYGLINKERI